MWGLPALGIVTLRGSVSNPVTLCPASAKRSASGKPTYPQPMIATLSCAPLKNSGFRSSGMSSVALLFISDSDQVGVKGFTFSGIPRRGPTHGRQQPTRPTGPTQVHIAGSAPTKKAPHYRLLPHVH